MIMFPLTMSYLQFLFGELLFVWRDLKRKGTLINALLGIVLSVCVILLLSFIESTFIRNSLDIVIKLYTFGSWIVAWCCSMFVIRLLTKLPLTSLLFIGSVAYIQQHLAYALTEVFFFLIGEVAWGWVFVMPFLLMLLLYPLILWKRNIYKCVDKSHIVLCVFVLFVCVFMNSFAEFWSIWMRIYDCCCCIFCYLLLYGESSKKLIRDNNEFLQMMIEKEHEQHTLSRQAVQMMNVKIHDLKHQIENLQQCVEGVEKLNSDGLKELQHTVAIFASMMNTGNETLDSIVMEKALICEMNNVHFSCIADGKNLFFMDSIDVFSLFNNLLDNAVESVIQEEEREKRYVTLCIERKMNMLLIHVENYCAREVKYENGIIETTKDNKTIHGFGMKGIKHVVEKYGGEMSMEWKDCVFSVGIIFNV